MKTSKLFLCQSMALATRSAWGFGEALRGLNRGSGPSYPGSPGRVSGVAKQRRAKQKRKNRRK